MRSSFPSHHLIPKRYHLNLPANMKLSLALVIAAAAVSHAEACNPWFGDCVSFYNGINCEGELGNYVPTSGGNCFVFSAFTSIFAARLFFQRGQLQDFF